MKVLFVTTRYPWPPRKGDQMRAAQHLEILRQHHQVRLLCPAPPPESPPPPSGVELIPYRRRPAGWPFRVARNLLRGMPLQSALMEEPELGRSLRALAPEVDWVILQLVRLAPHLEDVGSTPLMVDFIDSLALNFARRGELDRFWLRPLLRFEARRLEIWERRFAEVAQGSMVVCPRDRQEMLRNLPGEAGGRLRVVPVAVTPEERRTPSCPAEPPVVMVSGNLGYFPTVESAEWWARSVWPRLHRQRPEVRWRLAGARPPRRLRQIVESVGGEVVAGPKDLLGLLAQASVSLAPMRCGAGQPIKVMESWAVGVPVVASSWAAAGTTGRPGEDFLVADDPEEWVEAISRLLDEPETSQRLVANGKRRLRKDYGLAAVEGALLELLEGATG